MLGGGGGGEIFEDTQTNPIIITENRSTICKDAELAPQPRAIAAAFPRHASYVLKPEKLTKAVPTQLTKLTLLSTAGKGRKDHSECQPNQTGSNTITLQPLVVTCDVIIVTLRLQR